MAKTARKVRNQDINPCIDESDASQKCLDAYNYDKSMCSAYFQQYKNCRKYWKVSSSHKVLARRTFNAALAGIVGDVRRELSAITKPIMDAFKDQCRSHGLPVWIASLLYAARCLKSDCARRKKVYRLLHKKLMLHKVGVKEGDLCQPTYVYPEEVKTLLRSVFPLSIRDFPNPNHSLVTYVTVEDLHRVHSD